jgi:hypothetical protein
VHLLGKEIWMILRFLYIVCPSAMLCQIVNFWCCVICFDRFSCHIEYHYALILSVVRTTYCAEDTETFGLILRGIWEYSLKETSVNNLTCFWLETIEDSSLLGCWRCGMRSFQTCDLITVSTFTARQNRLCLIDLKAWIFRATVVINSNLHGKVEYKVLYCVPYLPMWHAHIHIYLAPFLWFIQSCCFMEADEFRVCCENTSAFRKLTTDYVFDSAATN